MEEKKQIIFIAGPNGAGKTTSALLLLPDFFKTNEFVNADEIARGLSPLNQDSMAVKAGKLMLQRVDELIRQNKSFGVETTLSGSGHKKIIKEAQSKGYSVGIVFLYLNSVLLAKKRVQYRVTQGGHNIPEDTIERRYQRGISNLKKIYLPLVDWAYVFDNSSQSEEGPIPVFYKHGVEETVINKDLWEKIDEQARKN